MKSIYSRKGASRLSSVLGFIASALLLSCIVSCSSFEETVTVNLVNNYEEESACFVVSFMDSSTYLIEKAEPSSRDNCFNLQASKTEYETYDFNVWGFTESEFNKALEEGEELYGTEDQNTIFANLIKYGDMKDVEYATDSRSFDSNDGFTGTVRIVFSKASAASSPNVRIIAED